MERKKTVLKSEHYTDSFDRIDIPVDLKLPGFSVMLDPKNVRSILAERLSGRDRDFGDCAIPYIRYKPGTNCIIAYRLAVEGQGGEAEILFYAKVHTAEDYSTAAGKSKAHRWIEIPGFEPVLTLPEQSAILYFYPNDCVIDGLRVLSDPKKIQRILYEYHDKYPESEWRISDRKIRLTVVRYKPERRVVLRCDTKAVNRKSGERKPLTVFLRIYGDERGADVFSLQQKLYGLASESGLFATPRPLAYLPDRKALIMEMAQGTQLLAKRESENVGRDIAMTAIALAAMHGFEVTGLEEKSAVDYLSEAGATRSTLESVLPSQKEKINTIFSLIENRIPKSGHSGLVHGDFYFGQVLGHDGQISILDFDRSHIGNTVYDVGNFSAHLQLLKMRGELDTGRELEDIFLKSYEELREIDPAEYNFWTAFGLFQLSVGPFRGLEQSWKEKTVDILAECERILES